MEPGLPVFIHVKRAKSYDDILRYLAQFGKLTNFDFAASQPPGFIVFGNIQEKFAPVPLENGLFNCVVLLKQANHLTVPDEVFKVIFQLKSIPAPLSMFEVGSFLAIFNPTTYQTAGGMICFVVAADGLSWFSKASIPLRPEEGIIDAVLPALNLAPSSSRPSTLVARPITESRPLFGGGIPKKPLLSSTRISADQLNMPPPTGWIDMSRKRPLSGQALTKNRKTSEPRRGTSHVAGDDTTTCSKCGGRSGPRSPSRDIQRPCDCNHSNIRHSSCCLQLHCCLSTHRGLSCCALKQPASCLSCHPCCSHPSHQSLENRGNEVRQPAPCSCKESNKQNELPKDAAKEPSVWYTERWVQQSKLGSNAIRPPRFTNDEVPLGTNTNSQLATGPSTSHERLVNDWNPEIEDSFTSISQVSKKKEQNKPAALQLTAPSSKGGSRNLLAARPSNSDSDSSDSSSTSSNLRNRDRTHEMDDSFTSISQVIEKGKRNDSVAIPCSSQSKHVSLPNILSARNSNSDSDSSDLSDTSTLFLKRDRTLGMPIVSQTLSDKLIHQSTNQMPLSEESNVRDHNTQSRTSPHPENSVIPAEPGIVASSSSEVRINSPPNPIIVSDSPPKPDDSQKTTSEVLYPPYFDNRRPGYNRHRPDKPSPKKRKLFNPYKDNSWFFEPSQTSGDNSQNTEGIIPPSDAELERPKNEHVNGREGPTDSHQISEPMEILEDEASKGTTDHGKPAPENSIAAIVMDWCSDNSSAPERVPGPNKTTDEVLKDLLGDDECIREEVVSGSPSQALTSSLIDDMCEAVTKCPILPTSTVAKILYADEPQAIENEEIGSPRVPVTEPSNIQVTDEFPNDPVKNNMRMQSKSCGLGDDEACESHLTENPVSLIQPSGRDKPNTDSDLICSIEQNAAETDFNSEVQKVVEEEIAFDKDVSPADMSETLLGGAALSMMVESERMHIDQMSLTLCSEYEDNAIEEIVIQTTNLDSGQNPASSPMEPTDVEARTTLHEPQSCQSSSELMLQVTDSNATEKEIANVGESSPVETMENAGPGSELNPTREDIRHHSPDSTTERLSEEIRRISPASTVFYDAEGDHHETGKEASHSTNHQLQTQFSLSTEGTDKYVAEKMKYHNATFTVEGVIVDINPHVDVLTSERIVKGVCRQGCKSIFSHDETLKLPSISKTCSCGVRSHRACPNCQQKGLRKVLCGQFMFELHVLIGSQVLRLQVESEEAENFLGIEVRQYMKKNKTAQEIVRHLEKMVCSDPLKNQEQLKGQVAIKTMVRNDEIVPFLISTSLTDFKFS